jgi:hypothetical protein
MGQRHELRPSNDHRLAVPGSSIAGRPGAHIPSAKALARMSQEATIPNIPAARRHPGAHRKLVRPYVRTRGRTQSNRDLAIEAIVSVRADAPWSEPEVTGEFRSVRTCCHRPRSVAEVAATLSVPLGVARVLLGDMAELGLVTVHETATTGDGRPALALMERVLHGLRRL